MSVYLIEWELTGFMPVYADTPEQAAKIARNHAHAELRNCSDHDLDFGTPRLVRCLEEACHVEPEISEVEGNCGVYGSQQTMRELLPSDPGWAAAANGGVAGQGR